jgi:integrase
MEIGPSKAVRGPLSAIGAGHLLSADLVASARGFAEAARSPRTRKAYRAAWAFFVEWCDSEGLHPLPAAPESVAAFLARRATQGRKVATLELELTAISQAHLSIGLPTPRSSVEVRTVLQGIRRTLGVAPDQKAPILPADLRRMLAALPVGLQGSLDRALLLVGYAGAFRRSELVGLDVPDVRITDDGLKITLRRSKTDQEAEGRTVGVPRGSSPDICAVTALAKWLEVSGLSEGPLFRAVSGGPVRGTRLSGRAVARLVKRSAELAGLDPRRYSGHSLRAGFATAAARAGKSERAIMRQTGHRSVETVRRYIREGDVFVDNAADGLL